MASPWRGPSARFPICRGTVGDASDLERLCGVGVELERGVAVADGGDALAELDVGVRTLGVHQRARGFHQHLGELADRLLVVAGGERFVRLLLELRDRVQLSSVGSGGDAGPIGWGVRLGGDHLGVGRSVEVGILGRRRRGGLGSASGPSRPNPPRAREAHPGSSTNRRAPPGTPYAPRGARPR